MRHVNPHRSAERNRVRALAGRIAVLSALSLSYGAAATYVYTGNGGTASAPVSDVFSDGFTPGTPVAGQTYPPNLSFGGSGADQYTADNDLSYLPLGDVGLNSTSSAVETISGGSLYLGKPATMTDLPYSGSITQNQAGSFTFSAPVNALTPATLTGSGSGALQFTNTVIGQFTKLGPYQATFTNLFTGVGTSTSSPALTVNGGTLNFNGGVGGFYDAGSTTAILASGGSVNINGTSAVNIRVGSVIASSGGAITAASSFSAPAVDAQAGGIINLSGSVVAQTGSAPTTLLASGGTLNLRGAVTLPAGTLAARTGGIVNVLADISLPAISVASTGTINVSGAGRLSGSGGGLTISGGGSLTLDNSGAAGATDCLADNVRVTLQGADLKYTGNAGGSAETAGPLIFSLLGGGSVSVVSNSATAPTTITYSLPSGPGLFRGTNLGSVAPGGGVANIFLAGDTPFSGSTSTASATNRGVLSSLADATATGAGATLATYDSVTGVRPLRAGEYLPTVAASHSSGSGDNVISSTAETLTGSSRVNSAQFSSGGGVTLPGTGVLQVSSGAVVFAPGNLGIAGGSLVLLSTIAPGLLWLQGAPSDSATITSTVFGGMGLVKAGAGTLILSSHSFIGGDVSVSAGRLRIGSTGSLVSSGNMQLGPGAIFDVSGGSASVNSLVADPAAGGITLGSGRLSTRVTSATVYAAPLSGAAGSVFTKDGTADLTLGYAGRTTLGTVVVNGSSLILGAGASLDAAITVNRGGSLLQSAPGQLVNTGLVTVNSAGSITGTLASAQPLTLNGGTVSQSILGASGTTAVNSFGALTLGAGHSLISTGVIGASFYGGYNPGSLTRQNSGTLTIGGTAPNTLFGLNGVPAGVSAGTVNASIVPYLIYGDEANGKADFVFNQGGDASASIQAGARPLATGEFYTTLSDSSGALANRSNYALSAAATISQASQIGTLKLNAGGSVGGTGALTVFTKSNGAATASAILALAGPSGPNTISVTTLSFGAQEAIFHVLDGNTSGDDLVVSSNVTGTAGLTKSSAGTLVLSGNNNGLSGPISVNDGTVRLDSATALGTGGSVQVTEQGTLDLGGNALSLSALSDGLPATAALGSTLAGGRITSAAPAVLTVSNAANSSSAFAGAVTGAVSLVKSGSGTLTLNGSNSFTGTTTVAAGTLALGVSGSLAGSTQIAVAHGATLVVLGPQLNLGAGQTVTGSGHVTGTIGGAGQVAPGSGAAILAVDGFSPGSGLGFSFDLTQAGSPTYGNAMASGNDVLRLTGATPFQFALTSGNHIAVDVSALSGLLVPGETVRGGFFSATDQSAQILGASWTYSGLSGGVNGFQVSMVPETAAFEDGVTSGYVVQFTAVPEPSAPVLMLLAVAAFLASRRRRRS